MTQMGETMKGLGDAVKGVMENMRSMERTAHKDVEAAEFSYDKNADTDAYNKEQIRVQNKFVGGLKKHLDKHPELKAKTEKPSMAVLGQAGCGKSSIINFLTGAY